MTNLVLPAKATMLIQNTVGALVARHINLETLLAEEKNGAHSVVIRYKLKGKRKLTGTRIFQRDTQLVIAKGWQSIEDMKETDIRGVFMPNEFMTFDDNDFDTKRKCLVDEIYTHTHNQ